MDNITHEKNNSVYLEVGRLETESGYIFRLVLRGVLNYIVQLIATFLNVTTIVAVFKYKNLQITSNALIVCFSIGHSLAFINGTLSFFTDFIVEYDTKTWRIACIVLGFFPSWQQYTNLISIVAISIERV